MADLFGDFGLGVVEGLATSTDAYLKKHISDNKDAFDKNLEAALSRNLERSTRYDKDTREAKEALELMAGFTNGDLGDAAAAIKGLGGYKQVKDFVTAYRTGLQTNKDLKFSDAVTFAADNPELTSQQAVNQLVTPLEFTIPKETTKRTGFLSILDDPRNMATEVPRILRERGIHPTQVDKMINLQGAQINWGALRTPEQEYSRRTMKATTELQEGKVTAQAQNLKILKDQVANLKGDQKRKIQLHESQMLDASLNRKDKTARLLAFNRENTPEMAELSRQKLVAEIIDKRSGNDAEQQWNILDSTQKVYEDQLFKRGDDQSQESGVLKARIESIEKSKKALLGTMAADASTVYSKDSPRSIFKESLETKLKAIMGTKFKDTIEGTIAILEVGQGYQVLEAYRDHAKEMGKLFGDVKHQGIKMQIELARQNARTAERLIFQKVWSMKGGGKPKNLYQVDTNTNRVITYPQGHKDEFMPVINPNLRPNDKVLVNDPEVYKLRSKLYSDPGRAVWMGQHSKLAGMRK